MTAPLASAPAERRHAPMAAGQVTPVQAYQGSAGWAGSGRPTNLEAPAAPVETAPPASRIAYFVHDASHADIGRRVDMLTRGGGRVRVLGFQRGDAPAKALTTGVVNLGRTRDARLLQRALSVLIALLRLPSWERNLDDADLVIARNLEMLALAVVARGRRARKAKLVYECLDIHRLMSGRGVASRVLRFVERLLLRRVDALMVSSPGFVREYFARQVASLPEIILLENKVGIDEKLPERVSRGVPPGPPWKIGWFGVIRCKRSLDLLIEAARRHPGLFEVVLAGRAASNIVGDLARELPEGLGIRYLGPFEDEAALAELFRSVHFAWLIDFYETGANSDWLLPNRLYRAAYYGAVPIALAGVETGRWLRTYDAGVLLDAVSPDRLIDLLSALSAADFTAAKAALERIPTAALVSDSEECAQLMDRFRDLG